MYCRLIACLFLFLCHCASAAMPEWFTAGASGEFRVAGLEFRLGHFSPGYKRYTPQNTAAVTGKLREEAEMLRFEGLFRPSSGEFKLDESFRRTGGNAVQYRARLTASPAVPSAELFLITTLPAGEFAGEALSVNGTPVPLPVRPGKMPRIQKSGVEKLVIPLSAGTLTVSGGRFRIQIQDNRGYRADTFSIRFYPQCDGELAIGRADLDLTFDYRGVNSFPLDLSKVANMGFADETPGDGKGGWTDQGPSNDLRMFRPGTRTFSGIDFSILDPEKNGGKSCIVLRGDQLPGLPAEASLEPAPKTEAGFLYLLHAAGWTKPNSRLGSVEITYADGSMQRTGLTVGVDAGNWWEPENLPNGTVVWRGANDHAALGLYLTCVRLDRRDPARITFRHGDGSLWMLVGATLTDNAVRRARPDEALFITAGKEYAPIDAFKPVRAGTVLDLSAHTEKPAGKHGRIIATPAGHLAFEKAPEKRIRMFGTNLCGSACFPSREYAPQLADELARMGYNSVRLHHIERDLAKEGGESSFDFDPEKLDRLDWFLHCLKGRGLYVTIDLFSIRAPRPGELPSVSAMPNTTHGFKALLPFEEAVRQNWCGYAGNLLNHVNPYTKQRWADDPVLFCVNLVNEDSLPGIWQTSDESRKLFREQYEAYLEKRGMRTEENLKAMSGPWHEFLHELQSKTVARMKRFIREELKSKVLITDLNWYTTPYLGILRGEQLDLVDNHQYTAHPTFLGERWRLPMKFSQASSISRYADNPRAMMPSRIFGKPFICTEYQFCSPNTSRTEGGALMGAYPALQDWDGLYRFAWAHGSYAFSHPVPVSSFDYSQSPERKLGEYLIYFQFVRGDVAPAPEGVAYPVDERLFRAGGYFPAEFSKLGLFTRIGGAMPGAAPEKVALLDSFSPAAIPERFREIAKRKSITSSTGEITLSDGELKITAPRFECVAGENKELSAGRIRLSGVPEFVTAALASIDGRPVAESGRMLFFCLANTAATMQKFSSPARTTLLSSGKLPMLVRRMQPDAAIALPPGEWRIRRIDCDGTDLGEHPSRYENGVLSFRPDTGTALVYEITNQNRIP
ncbi:MAG: hypothetical protein HPZ91_20460 [Lentisphaeria bacterium]|nr:hypothetical protein [Lentisphaeria bacterium]